MKRQTAITSTLFGAGDIKKIPPQVTKYFLRFLTVGDVIRLCRVNKAWCYFIQKQCPDAKSILGRIVQLHSTQKNGEAEFSDAKDAPFDKKLKIIAKKEPVRVLRIKQCSSNELKNFVNLSFKNDNLTKLLNVSFHLLLNLCKENTSIQPLELIEKAENKGLENGKSNN